jgi:hypothetical protein
MIHKRIFLFAALTLGVSLATAGGVRAQFSMSAIGKDAVDPPVEIPLELSPVDVSVINETHERYLRKVEWNRLNNIDFKASLTGMVTHFNDSWMTNNQNSVASELAVYFYHIYSRDKYTSTFKFDGIYGQNFIDDEWFKNQDMLRLEYLMSWKMAQKGAFRNWAYSFETMFLSQFAQGYKSRTEHDVWSNFMAPGTLRASLGFTYTSPDKKLPFIVTVSPISGNGLFVLDNRIDDDRRHKLGIALPGPAQPGQFLYTNRREKFEGGSSLNVSFNRTFTFDGKGLTLQYISDLNSFYGWMTQISRKQALAKDAAPLPAIKPTLGWTNRFIFNPLRFLSMEFRTTTVYDRSQIDKVQMQYYLRVGLTYRYKNR